VLRSAVNSEGADRIVDLYRRHARAWAAARGSLEADRPMEASWLDRFLGLLPPRPAVLDIGCGSGEPIGCYLAERGCVLTGIDSAPEMIDLCQVRLSTQTWRVADMRSLSLGRVFEGVLAWDSFFHLCPDDQRQMFAIFQAHAAPRAALMFTAGPDGGVAMGMLESEPLYHASLNRAEYGALLAQSGFDVVAHAVEDPTCGRHTIWLAQLR
jgi:trans-aconitate methyltransferase